MQIIITSKKLAGDNEGRIRIRIKRRIRISQNWKIWSLISRSHEVPATYKVQHWAVFSTRATEVTLKLHWDEIIQKFVSMNILRSLYCKTEDKEATEKCFQIIRDNHLFQGWWNVINWLLSIYDTTIDDTNWWYHNSVTILNIMNYTLSMSEL